MTDVNSLEPTPPDEQPDEEDARTARRNARIDFWFSSVAWGTLVAYLTISGILIVVFVRQNLADHASAGEMGTSILAAFLWALLGLIGTCYFSIPLATLVVAAVRGARRKLRKSSVEADPADTRTT
ncbi:hypothetical protein [Williamsia sp. CHRR-6]|uniref:hypothetical protein n=1 Tax=Williamsia sp. CHRR-6 TaxID=2835871 RepID=UPI001BDA55FC|nr:hypothetical protein [Williamsia sp. CHRR-6]MBT0566051.1 hypothetical protein [Williamsia sp. CHRR-6]